MAVLIGGVAGRPGGVGLRDALLGVAQDLRGLRPAVLPAVLGCALLGKRLGTGLGLFVAVRFGGVGHPGAYPAAARANPRHSADSRCHSCQPSVQSQMSPSASDSAIGLPVTSTGSPYSALL